MLAERASSRDALLGGDVGAVRSLDVEPCAQQRRCKQTNLCHVYYEALCGVLETGILRISVHRLVESQGLPLEVNVGTVRER
jgi:hypothetical protein